MLRRVLGLTVLALLLPLAGLRAQEASADDPPVVEVIAQDYEFGLPAEVASGWTTFEFRNAGEEEHFASLIRLPEGKTYRDLEISRVAVDLEPGEYAWMSQSYAARGMVETFTVE